MTLDQLSYILERKYNNIRIGSDVIIICTTTRSENGRFLIKNPDACIAEWNINDIPQPTVENIHKWWTILEEQYNSDPSRVDSKMYAYLNKDQYKDITENDI